MLPEVPALITNALTESKAVSTWTFDLLGEHLGQKEVEAAVEFDGVTTDVKNGSVVVRERIRFGDFIKAISTRQWPNGHRQYLTSYPVENLGPLAKDFSPPEYCPTNMRIMLKVWIGPEGTVTPLHYDVQRNVLTQIIGRKRVVLISPRHFTDLYPYSSFSRMPQHSRVSNYDAPDLAAFPRFRDVPAVELVLEPGQMLYIPPMWWHFVTSLDPSVSINAWWPGPLRDVLSLRAGRHALLAAQINGMREWFRPAQKPLVET
jgi:lysine-specific demethylase 8